MLKQYPALDGLEKVADMSKQFAWVKYSELAAETKETWGKLQNSEIGANEALAQVEQIGNRVLAGT